MSMTRTYITRTLSDIMPGFDDFDTRVMSELNFDMDEDEKNYLFILMYSRYADSHVRYTNESLFILNIKKEIMAHYPTVLAMIRDQKTMRDTPDETFQTGGRMIINMAAHNTANVPNDTTQGIGQLDSQQINNSERARIDILMQRMDAYRSDMEDRFLLKFVKYFIQVIAPQRDLLYWTETGASEDSED